jgi:hypothetical protein
MDSSESEMDGFKVDVIDSVVSSEVPELFALVA